MYTVAKLFMSGRSQALRLPSRLRLDGNEVRIEKIGSALWVHPETSPEHDMAAWLARFYASTDPLPEEFLVDRLDAPPQARDWG
jgi:antitoxin VapB